MLNSAAIAELNKQLQKFVSSLSMSKRKPNFSQVAVHGMPAGCGRKGSQAPRKRKQSQPGTEREDRISSTQNYTWNSTSQAVRGSNNNTLNIHLDSPTRQFQAGVMPHCSQGPSLVTPVLSHMSCVPSYVPSGTPWMPSYYDWYTDF